MYKILFSSGKFITHRKLSSVIKESELEFAILLLLLPLYICKCFLHVFTRFLELKDIKSFKCIIKTFENILN